MLDLISLKGKPQTLRVNSDFVEGRSIYVLHQGKGGALKPGWVEASEWVRVTEGKSDNRDTLTRKRKEALESVAGPPGKAGNYQTRMSKTQTTNINNKKIKHLQS